MNFTRFAVILVIPVCPIWWLYLFLSHILASSHDYLWFPISLSSQLIRDIDHERIDVFITFKLKFEISNRCFISLTFSLLWVSIRNKEAICRICFDLSKCSVSFCASLNDLRRFGSSSAQLVVVGVAPVAIHAFPSSPFVYVRSPLSVFHHIAGMLCTVVLSLIPWE